MHTRTVDHVDHSSNPSSCALQDPNSPVNTILSSRKCWRVMKGKNEPVWPPALEAALIAGMEKYVPTGSRSTKALGRLPMRNKFIAEYIFKTTGKRRTPKQVGSRIQQLRDTNSGKQIVKTLSDRHYEMLQPRRPEDNTPDQAVETLDLPNSRHVYIEVPMPDDQSFLDVSSSDNSYHRGPQPLHNIDPTIAFVSTSRIDCYSSFQVTQNGVLVASETTTFDCYPMPSSFVSSGSSGYLYSTMLVPNFWPHICSSSDPTSYTITQQIFPTNERSRCLSSVFYHFLFASPASRSISPVSGDDGSSITDFSSDSCSNVGTELGQYLSLNSSLSMSASPVRSAFGPEGPFLVPEPMYNGSTAYTASPPASPLETAMINVIPWPNNTFMMTHISSTPGAPFNPGAQECNTFFAAEQAPSSSCYNGASFTNIRF